MGFDFHVGADGPRLIEINTNAGGALLNLALMRAQQACCGDAPEAPVPGLPGPDALERAFLQVFVDEWRSQRGGAAPRSVLIVDDQPAAQYLAPEFELFRRLFERNGISATVVDAGALDWRDGRLVLADGAAALGRPGAPGGLADARDGAAAPIDLVYNRLTDFDLSEPHHAALRRAYETGAVVVTPGPRAHALLADKRNLALLGDAARLAGLGAAQADCRTLASTVPHTQPVTADNADALWAQRRSLFFKPVAGYGAKAAWRGDKLTRRVWEEILAGDFVAQQLVPPSQRAVALDGVRSGLKFDVRAYAYRGRVQMLAARIYQGQATNFRTPGGGFAPVVVVP